MRKVSARWYSLLLGAAFVFGVPGTAWAQTTLSWAKVERLRNRVHLIPSNRNARLARLNDFMNVGDALRTASSSRAELRFNDGSLARVGEQATFRFSPNTRNFQLSNGTVLLLIPPGRGRTTIQTPNAVTGIQGSALFVRVRCLAELSAEGYCASPVTVVGALTNNPAGAMIAYNETGSQQQAIYAGEMVVIEGDIITERHQFDLSTFYQTSGLVEGLQLDSQTPPDDMSEELQEVWQEIQDALKLQGDFDSQDSAEEIVENPSFIAPLVANGSDNLDESISADVFASFPTFLSSPASTFHGTGAAVANAQSGSNISTTVASDLLESDTSATVTSGIVRDSLTTTSTATNETAAISPAPAPVVSTPSVPTVVETPTPVDSPVVVTTPSTPVVTAPTPVEPPSTPVVTTPTIPVDTPSTTSVVATPTTPVETPSTTPDVATPTTPVEAPSTTPIVETPTAVITETPQEIITPTLEAEQTQGREAVAAEEFDWQQPAGANDPEVLQTPDFTINDSGEN